MNTDQTSVIDLLTQEHTALRRAVNVLTIMTDRVESEAPTDRHDVNALLIFFHYFGDVLHQAKEESILFPALKFSDKGASSTQLESLLEEHNEERGLVEKTQFLLFTDDKNELIASARKVIDLLSQHMDKEEHALFPLADRILTMAKANEVTLKLKTADAVFGFRQRELLMEMLRGLEDKYIRKAA